MKIVSWNVNGIRSCAQKGLKEFLDSEKPDIFCIQETKANPEQVDNQLRNYLDMKSYWSSSQKRKGYSGVSTYLKTDSKKVKYGMGIDKYDLEGRFVITEHNDFSLYNIYFPNGGSGEERHNFKQEFLKDLCSHLKPKLKKGENIIIVGDYNIAHKEVDIYDPKRLAKHSGFLPEERQWFGEFLELGFIDTFRYFHPEEKDRYSWWSYREMARPGNRGWRIDYICVSKGLEKKLKSADILDQIHGSDHCPVVLELK